MSPILQPPLAATPFTLLYGNLLLIRLTDFTILCLFFLSLSRARRREPNLCPPPPAASSHQHGRQSTARRRCSPVGPIRGAGGHRQPRSQWLPLHRLQDLPAQWGPHGHRTLLCQGEWFQWGANWCPRYNCRYDMFTFFSFILQQTIWHLLVF